MENVLLVQRYGRVNGKNRSAISDLPTTRILIDGRMLLQPSCTTARVHVAGRFSEPVTRNMALSYMMPMLYHY
jgi:hypothetical protein